MKSLPVRPNTKSQNMEEVDRNSTVQNLDFVIHLVGVWVYSLARNPRLDSNTDDVSSKHQQDVGGTNRQFLGR